MPNIKSKIKNVRRIEKRRTYNRAIRSKIRTIAKRIDVCLQDDKKEENKEPLSKLLSLYFKAVDKAQKRNVLKPNTAARRKSKMSKLLFPSPASAEPA